MSDNRIQRYKNKIIKLVEENEQLKKRISELEKQNDTLTEKAQTQEEIAVKSKEAADKIIVEFRESIDRLKSLQRGYSKNNKEFNDVKAKYVKELEALFSNK